MISFNFLLGSWMDDKYKIINIKDILINNPRLEIRNFGDSYEDAEGYYSKLFFKYQFEEV